MFIFLNARILRNGFWYKNKDVYSIVNGANYFDKVTKNVRNLVKNREKSIDLKIGLHFVLQKANYLYIDNFLNLVENLKVDFISFDTLIYDSNKKVFDWRITLGKFYDFCYRKCNYSLNKR